MGHGIVLDRVDPLIIRSTSHFSLLCAFHLHRWLQARSLPDRMPLQSAGEHWSMTVSVVYFLLSLQNNHIFPSSWRLPRHFARATGPFTNCHKRRLRRQRVGIITVVNHAFSNCLLQSPGTSSTATFYLVCFVLEVRVLESTPARATLGAHSLVR